MLPRDHALGGGRGFQLEQKFDHPSGTVCDTGLPVPVDRWFAGASTAGSGRIPLKAGHNWNRRASEKNPSRRARAQNIMDHNLHQGTLGSLSGPATPAAVPLGARSRHAQRSNKGNPAASPPRGRQSQLAPKRRSNCQNQKRNVFAVGYGSYGACKLRFGVGDTGRGLRITPFTLLRVSGTSAGPIESERWLAAQQNCINSNAGAISRSLPVSKQCQWVNGG
uniref:Uncharacterized protein n=1 Tax=Trichuris muris TaxID=70415 RepID=A0A5S6QDF6_TRIMR